MAFFKKLKDRLFKSSAKIEEGLEAIVQDGGEAELLPAPEGVADAAPAGPAARAPAVEDEIRTRVGAPAGAEAGDAAADEPRADAPRTAPAPLRASDDPDWPEEPIELPDLPEPMPESPPPGSPQPTDPEPFEPGPGPDLPEPGDVPPQELPEAPPEYRPGFLGRLFGRGEGRAGQEAAPAAQPAGPPRVVVRRVLDDAMLESIEELLIASDMGVDTAVRVTANIAEGRFGRKLSTDEIKGLLASEVARIMEPVARPLPLYPKKPQVVLVVGVNGSGKTTTIGKLASQFRAAGKKVVIAAGDTFRAAAVEQLQIWGERAGVPVLTAPEGSDPASLAWDAMEQAQRDGADLLMIDTAGRLQNRADLMEELAKIVRVIRKKDPDAPHNTLLVLDATTGQNALSQVEIFQKLADVSGLVMTKLDGTAKGGVLVALADRFGLPIHAIGVGEQIDDLQPFDPDEFAQALTGAAA